DVDVQAPGGEDAESMDFDAARRRDERQSRVDRGVVTLDVPHHENPAGAAGAVDQVFGLRERSRDRLLHEDVEPAVQKETGDLGVGDGRGRDDDGFGFARDLLEARKSLERKLARDLLRAPGMMVVHANDLEPGERRRDSRVMPSEVPDADHGQPDLSHRWNPRLLSRMKATSSSTHGPDSSLSIRSSAWLVFSFDFTSSR